MSVAPMPRSEKDLVHIGGDVADPSGTSSARGYQTTYNLENAKIGTPQVRYRDRAGNEFLLTVDVYKHEGEPMELHLYCPQCSEKGRMHTLRITADKKHVEYELGHNPNVPWGKGGALIPLGGRLSVERFRCTHELDSTRGVSVVASANLCNWQVVIDSNIARDV